MLCPTLPCTRWHTATASLPRGNRDVYARCISYTVARSSAVESYAWTGVDEFTAMEDRRDLPPLALPSITKAKRVTLVRHGQSTWNAAGRIQGSSNLSKLTDKGIKQAQTTHGALQDEQYDALYYSSLERASHTAKIVWGSRSGPTVAMPSLREVDLYTFQVWS
jgi:hypothetical protein